MFRAEKSYSLVNFAVRCIEMEPKVMRVLKRRRPADCDIGSKASNITDKVSSNTSATSAGLLSEARLNPEVLIGYSFEWDGGSGEILGLKDGTTPVKYRVYTGKEDGERGTVKLFDVRKKKKVKVLGRGAIWLKEKAKEVVPAKPGDMARARQLAKINAAKNRQEAEKGPGTGSIDAIFDTLPDKMKAKKARVIEHEKQMKEEEEEQAQIDEEEAMYLGRDVEDGAGRSSDGMGGWKWDGNEG
jgi:hypothetical protein